MHLLRQILIVLVACILVSCEKQRDRNGILSERAMVDILYDYQMAMALASENAEQGKLAETEYRYANAVFKKHGITDEDFNLSVAHYARDPKQMLAITDKVSARLSSEMEQTELKHDDDNLMSNERLDTVVVWENRAGTILTANYNNLYSFSLSGEKFAGCERVVFGSRTKWIYREGMKSGTVILSVTFDNDSVGRQQSPMRDYDRSQGLSVTVPEGRRVKKVDVNVYQNARWQKYPQVLSLGDLSLWNIKKTKNDDNKKPNRENKSSKQDTAAKSNSSANEKPGTESAATSVPPQRSADEKTARSSR